MCVKIVKNGYEINYEPSKPLETQLEGSQKVIVDYKGADSDLDKFLDEVKRFAKTGVDMKLNIDVMHNDHLLGYKAKKKINAMARDISLNEVIKRLVMLQIEVDRKLAEIAKQCNGIGCNE